jgi:hypothetical protein
MEWAGKAKPPILIMPSAIGKQFRPNAPRQLTPRLDQPNRVSFDDNQPPWLA